MDINRNISRCVREVLGGYVHALEWKSATLKKFFTEYEA